ncbi:N-acetylmuramoyl-L-alanine amidase family protein [Bacillus rubiinfantis]|uniref:N-acetylmuramoyl-L-alanine amidase family protein n=1 Tax=Bacillus rubiinfantis TaxID=1499680 RepID=UPI0005A9B2B7|nr:N-acetylmuramoyl-L-alanine amidase [Bacillus rubiinfantis]
MVKIFIDPGHGGNDSGATGNGLKEKDVTLKIAKAIKSKLKEYENVKVKLSRYEDETLALRERTEMANSWGADVFISIHLNSASSDNASGFESFIYTNTGSRTRGFQDILHSEIMKLVDNYTDDDRGKHEANFHVLRESSMMACLTENLFVSNKADAELLKDEEFINAVAEGHKNGIVKFYDLKKK